MKKAIFTLLFASLTVVSMAQSGKGRVKGIISDQTTKELLPGATVALLHAKDSSIEASAFADKNGAFDIQGIDAGKYQLFITYIGYQGFYKTISMDSAKVIDLGGVTLSQKGVALGGVEIVEQIPPIRVKPDTLEFNAGSFKTRENALTEDLLKKLPGVVVDKDGAITANGEKVTKVFVDGKPFFGNDPKLATRNLPADIIDKIQLIDKKSDQAEFTGVNDGEIEKIINITIKSDKRKGIFGRGTVGYGTDDRYGANGMFNNFQNTRKISVIAGANNVNNMGFSFQDQFSFGGGGGGGRGGGTSGGGSGLNTSWNAGLNFNDEYGKRKQVRVNGSYFINHMDRVSGSWNRRQQLTLGEQRNQVTYDTSNAERTNLNHRLNARIEWDIDSFHSVIINPSFSFNTADNMSSNKGSAALAFDNSPINTSSRVNSSNATRPEISGDIQLRKRFRKKGRSVSATFGLGYNASNQDNYTDGLIYTFADAYEKITNQLAISDNVSKNYNIRVDYTEPIFTDRYLELGYNYRNNAQDNDRRTYRYNTVTDRYDLLDEDQTNLYRNDYSNQQASIAIRTQKLKYDYSIGGRLQINDQTSNNLTKSQVTNQNVINFAPELRFNYNYSRNKRLRLNYRGQTQQPSMDQLQPVPDSTNPLYVLQGNPDLKPSFTHRVEGQFNSFDPAKMAGYFVNLNAQYVTNQIVYSALIDAKGATQAKYINVSSGNYNFNANISNTIPLFHKATSLNLNTGLGYSRAISYLNDELNITKNMTAGERASLNYFFKELFDVSAAGYINYTAARIGGDSVSAEDKERSNTNFYDFGWSLDFNVNLPLGIRIGGDIDYTANRGRGADYDLDYTMVNGFVSKTVFKNKKGEFKAQVFDLFRQNIAISRNVSTAQISDSRNIVLQRYFMLSFTYTFGKFGGGRGRGQGGPPGGEFRGRGEGGNFRGGAGGGMNNFRRG
ncbi:outer membrane beta-barrel protein [uncultured Chitinophaga sp.]|uniref:outer membrane beta-barrel protein n=1 Tax=uncultured Chitinophaga sp. TaxID=339340 RepID=UPI0025D01EDF|nr:outer membrane beta-barrel protein [uncultured Chitinophaga sp.]